MCVSAIGNPPMKNQITFIINAKQPDVVLLLTAFLSKGSKAISANFNDCKPKGMPIMVIIKPNLSFKSNKRL